ncbi:MAG: ubiquinone/menaquinone biosynthesis C-methylase UbiE [Patiriisocius sp.]|jgi:ubiquinone/menaquinone biosynthesis C-methylase UbiE
MEDRYIETHKTWNNIAHTYEEKFMDIELYNDTYKRFCNLLSKPDATVLEIGCGPGNITRHILNMKPKLKILATDISENMITLTKKNNPEVDTQILDCRNLKSIHNKFDGIVCGFTVPYLSKDDCLKMISDCGSILTEGGVLYLSFIAGDPKKSGFIAGSSGERAYFYHHQFGAIKQTLELNKMDIVDQRDKEYKKADNTVEIHTIINAKKTIQHSIKEH